MRRIKLIIRVLAVLTILLGVVTTILVRRSDSVERWIGGQLQLIANSYLKPRLSFTDLHYTYPNQVSLKNFRLEADDPAQPGKTIEIIASENASISLAEVPAIGKPIAIERISFDKPVISAVAMQPGSKDFVGFSQLLRKADVQTQQEIASKPASRLSDLLRMREVQLGDGKIIYNPRLAGTLPMVLDHITTVLNFEPADAGWYKLGTRISRAPLFDLHVAGLLNLDTFSVKDLGVELLTDLGQEKIDYLPPEIQRLIKQYDARGKLSVSISGSMPVMEPLKGNVTAHLKLGEANLTMGACRIPVDNLELVAEMADGKMMLPKLHVEALGGTADLTASLSMNTRRDAQLHLAVAGMQLNQLLADHTRAAGTTRLDGELNVTGALMAILGKVPISEAPASVSLDHLRLSTDDPRSPGNTIDVLACDHAAVTMASALVPGSPLKIDSIVLRKVRSSLVAIKPNSLDIAGISDLITLAGPTAPSPAQPANAPSTAPVLQHKLSDLIRIGQAQIDDAGIVYDPRIPGTDAMNVDQINSKLELATTGPNAGSYKMSVDISRKPAFLMTISGMLDPDAPGVSGFDMHLSADANQGKLDYLLPQLQLLLKQYKTKGNLDVSVRGAASLLDPFAGPLDVKATLNDASANLGNRVVPLKAISLAAHIEDGKLTLPSMNFAAANTKIDLSGSVALDGMMDSDLHIKLANVVIENLLAAVLPERIPATSTTIDAEILFHAPLLALLAPPPDATGDTPISGAQVTVKNLSLGTDDPRAPGNILKFADCENINVGLRLNPIPGQPLIVDNIDVVRPDLRLVAVSPGAKQFAGFRLADNLLADNSSSASKMQPQGDRTVAKPIHLNSIVRLGHLEVTNADVLWDERLPNCNPILIQPIHIAANSDVSKPSAEYSLSATAQQSGKWELSLGSRLNADELSLRDLNLRLDAAIAQDKLDNIPSNVRQLLNQYDIVGNFHIAASGSLDFGALLDSDMTTQITGDAAATCGDYRIQIDRIRLPARYHGGRVDLLAAAPLGGSMVEALNGTADLTGYLGLDKQLTSNLDLHVNGMLLQKLTSQSKDPTVAQLAGQLDSALHIQAPLLLVADEFKAAQRSITSQPASAPTTSATAGDATTAGAAATTFPTTTWASTEPSLLPDNWGNGTLNLTHARLVNIPVVDSLTKKLESLFTHEKQDVPNDRVELTYTLSGGLADFSAIHYVGGVLGVRGKGTLTMSQYLDLTIKAGPLEKLEAFFSSGIANVIDSVSDALITYHITGTLNDPSVEVVAGKSPVLESTLAKGAHVAKEGVVVGAKKVGEGVGAAAHQLGKWLRGGD